MADSFLNIKISSKGKLFKVSGQNITISKDLQSRLGDKSILKKDAKEMAEMIKELITTNILTAKDFIKFFARESNIGKEVFIKLGEELEIEFSGVPVQSQIEFFFFFNVGNMHIDYGHLFVPEFFACLKTHMTADRNILSR